MVCFNITSELQSTAAVSASYDESEPAQVDHSKHITDACGYNR